MSKQKKRHTPEQIVRKLGHSDRLLGEGKTVADVCRELEVAEQTYYRWRNQYGGMKADDAKSRPAGQWVHVTEDISMDSPLAGRALRFWPETLLNSVTLKQRVVEEPSQLQRAYAEQLEEQRLFYVAMTRSVHRTVLAPKTEVQKLQAFASDTVDVQLTQEPADQLATLTISSNAEQHEPPTKLQDAVVLDLKHISSKEYDLEVAAGQRAPVAEPASARILAGRGQPVAGDQLLSATFKASHRLADETVIAKTRVERIGIGLAA